jgi:hypothetical protein
MYFLSNNIKKNQNKINICDSDVMALRERVQSLTNKVNSMEEYLNKGMIEKKQGNPIRDETFTNILEKLSSMNGDLEDYDEEDDEDDSEEDSEDDSEEDDSDDEDDESEDEDGDSDDDESEEDIEDILEEDEIIKEEEVPVVVKEEEAPVKEEELGIDNIIQDEVKEPSKKYPDVDLSGLNVGTVMLGSDGKTKYVVSSNKAGKKSWKKSK